MGSWEMGSWPVSKMKHWMIRMTGRYHTKWRRGILNSFCFGVNSAKYKPRAASMHLALYGKYYVLWVNEAWLKKAKKVVWYSKTSVVFTEDEENSVAQYWQWKAAHVPIFIFLLFSWYNFNYVWVQNAKLLSIASQKSDNWSVVPAWCLPHITWNQSACVVWLLPPSFELEVS